MIFVSFNLKKKHENKRKCVCLASHFFLVFFFYYVNLNCYNLLSKLLNYQLSSLLVKTQGHESLYQNYKSISNGAKFGPVRHYVKFAEGYNLKIVCY